MNGSCIAPDLQNNLWPYCVKPTCRFNNISLNFMIPDVKTLPGFSTMLSIKLGSWNLGCLIKTQTNALYKAATRFLRYQYVWRLHHRILIYRDIITVTLFFNSSGRAVLVGAHDIVGRNQGQPTSHAFSAVYRVSSQEVKKRWIMTTC